MAYVRRTRARQRTNGRRRVAGIVAPVLALALALRAPPSIASTMAVPDGDTATLLAILFDSVKQTASLGQLLTSVEQSLATARNTLAVLRSASEAVNEFRYLAENPDEIFLAADAAFRKTFPEVEAIRNEAERLRDSVQQGTRGQLNPYALQEMLDNVGRTQESFYETLLQLDEGVYGLTEGHVALLKQQDALASQASDVFKETMAPGCRAELDEEGKIQTVCGLDQRRAGVLAAKSAAISAASLNMIGVMLTQQLRIAKLTVIKKLDDGARAGAVGLDHARGLSAVALSVDETLDPLRREARAVTFIDRPQGGGLAPLAPGQRP